MPPAGDFLEKINHRGHRDHRAFLRELRVLCGESFLGLLLRCLPLLACICLAGCGGGGGSSAPALPAPSLLCLSRFSALAAN